MIEMQVAEGESLERALRAFRKKVMRAGVLQDIRKKRHYLKPSEARQAKRAAASKRRRKASRRES